MTAIPARFLTAGDRATIAGKPEDVWAVVLGATEARIRTSITGWHNVGLDDQIAIA